MRMEIELSAAQVAMLDFLRERTDMGLTNAQLAQRFVADALAQELSNDHILRQWAHWCVAGTFPQEDDA